MISKSWKKIKVSDLGKIITGKTPPTKKNEYWGGTIPFLTPSDNMDQKHIITTRRYITDKAVKDFNNNILPSETICVSCIGSDLGKVVKTKVKLMTNQQINSIIPHDGFDNDFIYYRMILLGKKLNYLSKTSTAVPIINKTTFSNFSIKVPNIVMQKEISKTLSLLDDKIELNNKINNNLEELAQTLYKHWFVDFEFPNEEGLPYKSSGGKMVESELGLIPEGWEIREQGDYFPVITGKKNANYATLDGKFKFFTCSQQVFQAPDYSFDGTAILVAGNGDFNVKYYSGKFEAYQRTYVLIPKNSNLAGLFYFMIKENLNKITSGHRGSVIKFITKGDLENYKIITPDNEKLEKFSYYFTNIINTIEHNKSENEKLTKLRDLLLPKLMSGEIRVPIKE